MVVASTSVDLCINDIIDHEICGHHCLRNDVGIHLSWVGFLYVCFVSSGFFFYQVRNKQQRLDKSCAALKDKRSDCLWYPSDHMSDISFNSLYYTAFGRRIDPKDPLYRRYVHVANISFKIFGKNSLATYLPILKSSLAKSIVEVMLGGNRCVYE